jgi:hypothetical protein
MEEADSVSAFLSIIRFIIMTMVTITGTVTITGCTIPTMEAHGAGVTIHFITAGTPRL